MTGSVLSAPYTAPVRVLSTMTVESARRERALASLLGLSIGDALGSQFFVPDNYPLLRRRELPPAPWQWTDDTEMASSVVAVLDVHGAVDQDRLAQYFARHHDFDRGYGPAVNRMLRQIRQENADWRKTAAELFEGRGSWGNGASMRVAPLGAWFSDDAERAADEAQLSAYVTHQHREAVCGAMAVAAATALRLSVEEWQQTSGDWLLAQVAELVPRSAVQAGIRRARDMLDYGDVATVAAVLGCGRRTSAQDTVPFALWAAARYGSDFTEAIWSTAAAGGDVDTTCAIVGGVLGAAAGCAPPHDWVERAEQLPGWVPGQG